MSGRSGPGAGETREQTLTLEERLIAALIEYDDALCLHAGMIARKERFTRRDGWGLVEWMREKHNGPALTEELRQRIASAGQPSVATPNGSEGSAHAR